MGLYFINFTVHLMDSILIKKETGMVDCDHLHYLHFISYQSLIR